MKACIDCRVEKELSEFPKRKYSKDGHRNTCKVCRLKRIEFRRINPVPPKEILAAGLKRCFNCKEIKSTDEFGTSKLSKDKLRNYCKECKKKEDIEYRKNNPEKLRKYRAGRKEKIAYILKNTK